MNKIVTKVTAYINEADKWNHRPLYLEILNMLQKNDIAAATVLHTVAGFTNKHPIETTSLVDIGSQLPLVVQFVDTSEKVNTILSELIQMVGQRLVIS
ncbi:MAG: DUF190 domain-containing protein, partial [Legionella sp.]